MLSPAARAAAYDFFNVAEVAAIVGFGPASEKAVHRLSWPEVRCALRQIFSLLDHSGTPILPGVLSVLSSAQRMAKKELFVVLAVLLGFSPPIGSSFFCDGDNCANMPHMSARANSVGMP